MSYMGILPINKPRGMTSHDVVFKARKILKMKKIGHTGTLDPEVDGVLVLCLGQATKLVEYLMDGEKIYHGEITLGVSTETEDAHGAVVDTTPVEAPLSMAEIDEKMASMTGLIQQIPPMYSAVKVKGKRLYEYARAGEEVERPVREAQIHSFVRTSEPVYDAAAKTQSWSFDVHCGKGTYVRTLAVDLGEKLGFPAHMSDLRRLATSGFNIEEAVTLEELAEAVEAGTELEHIYPMDRIKASMPHLVVGADKVFNIEHGQVVPDDFFGEPLKELTAIFNEAGTLLAIYGPHPSKPNLLKSAKGFHYEEEVNA
ncbi:tRNA pseudouridine(55) synthase TruB [Aerococcaceae bacterium DSM 111022]|nr:tRNA pseudouridine(55) synthase TruB [Aerococcaceae bacterium DSM 111022]MBG9988734.1 tRNA pseudouridine(55) synthase TruB [Aerococcaceae bacterium DSM 111176]